MSPSFQNHPRGCTHRLCERAAYGSGLSAAVRCREKWISLRLFCAAACVRLRKNDRRMAALKFASSSVAEKRKRILFISEKS